MARSTLMLALLGMASAAAQYGDGGSNGLGGNGGNGGNEGYGGGSNGFGGSNGGSNGRFGDNNRGSSNGGYGAESVDPIEELGALIPGGGVPGEDYPILAAVPDTGFECFAPGYYADIAPEAGCQVFHICQDGGHIDSFLCPNGTIFNQQYFVCDWWYNFDCATAEDFYELNELIGEVDPYAAGNNGGSAPSDVYGAPGANGNNNGNGNGQNGQNGNGRRNGNGDGSRRNSNGYSNGNNNNGASGSSPSTSYSAPDRNGNGNINGNGNGNSYSDGNNGVGAGSPSASYSAPGSNNNGNGNGITGASPSNLYQSPRI